MVLREMTVSGWELLPILGRPFQAQPAEQFGLEDAARHWPHLDPARNPLSAKGHVHGGRLSDRYGCSIDTFHDQDTITHLLPCPAINFLGRKSRIDSQAEDGHHNPVMRWEALVQDLRELVPDLNVGCIAF